MKTMAFQPRHPRLQGLIEYFFFNGATTNRLQTVQTSYANTNICLGVLRAAGLEFSPTGIHQFTPKLGLQSYLTGLYLSPHRVHVTTAFSEICINFTPLGYYHFFDIPLAEVAGQNDILYAAFGQSSIHFFEQVFERTDEYEQLTLLETFFLQRLTPAPLPDLVRVIALIHHTPRNIFSVSELYGQADLHAKKLYRLFKTYLGISPKEYLQMHRFRSALKLMENAPTYSLTQIAYQAGYYDQSHFIKEIRRFTGKCPRHLVNDLLNVDDLLLLKIEI